MQTFDLASIACPLKKFGQIASAFFQDVARAFFVGVFFVGAFVFRISPAVLHSDTLTGDVVQWKVAKEAQKVGKDGFFSSMVLAT